MTSVTRRMRAHVPASKTGVEESLLGAMERLLASGQSFTSVSVEQLANEAGIARSTFYLHFRDKGDLVQRLMSQVTREILTAAGSWFDKPEIAERSDLQDALRQIVAVYNRHRAVMRAMTETAAYDANVARLYSGMMDNLVGESRRTLERIRRAGRAHPGMTPEVGDVLTWMVEHACYQLLGGKTQAETERMITSLTHIVWNAIYAPAPLKKS
jgi:AcrR family transcriptional regulator